MSRIVKKPEQRRREIVLAAQTLFLKKEYDKTSLQDVISTVGIAKGTVYHYFDSKEELLTAVVENMVEEYLAAVRTSFDTSKSKKALERMHQLMKASNISYEQGSLIEQLHRAGNIDLHIRLLARTLQKLAPFYAEVIQQGCEEGVFHTEHPLEAAEMLLAGIQFITDVGLYPWSQEEVSRRKEAMTSLMEVQLGAKNGALKSL